MKFSLIFATLALLLVVASALKKAPTCNPLTLRCKCSNIKQLVCGVSGKTHTNPCIANCFNDKVKHQGPCTNQCKTSKQKCSLQPFGNNGGKRLKCCDEVNVCFGKTCTNSEKNCKWKGSIIIKKKRGHCFWKKKNGNKYQRICCKWQKICKGSCKKGSRRCYTTLKRCRWTGRVIKTRKNKSCSFINTEHGKRKRCCVYTSKCINYDRLTCKSKRKPKCWATRKCKMVGPFTKRRCSRKCQRVAVGKYGSRKRCCHSCTKCQSFKYTETPKKRSDVCQTKITKCLWKGPIVVRRHHRKCSIKAYGENKDRKRCCKWVVRCVGKHCKIVHKKCSWIGCVIHTKKRRICRIRMKNDHQKQRFCCRFTRKCCGAKCVNYNQKCKFVGKIQTTHNHWKCRMVKIGKNGKRRKCCRFTRVCFGKKCQVKLGKCQFRGCLKKRTRVSKCSVKRLTKNIKCKYCCTSVKKCDCGICRNTNTKCKCVKKYATFHFTKCKMQRKRKGVEQQRCCVYKRICQGKLCKVKKTKRCKWTGFEKTYERKYHCQLKKVAKGAQKRYCCYWTRQCFGFKCKNSKKRCRYIGKEISKKVIYNCKIRHYKKNSQRKRCCAVLRVCSGLRCKKLNRKCKWVGHIFKRKSWVRSYWKKVKKFCHRKQICRFKQSCFGSKCSRVSRKCSFVGKVVCRYRRVVKSWKKTRKGCKLRKLCVVSSVCSNDKCTSTKPKCRFVGKEKCKQSGKFCKWSHFKGKCFKRRCCSFKANCVGTNCQRKLFACSWVGKQKCRTHRIKCQVVKYKKSFKRTKCCKQQRTCVGKKCKSRVVWCRWKGSSHKYKQIRKCIMVPIKKHKFIMIKRKRCMVWRRYCQKKHCKTVQIKKFWVGKKIIIRKFRKCQLKKFSEKYSRSKCCRFIRVCHGKKCRDLKRGCFWYGKKILVKLEALLRWKVICRDVPFGKRKNIRLNCCRVQQRCVKSGPAFRCENIKRSKCWWRGSIRGDVWIQDQNGEWVEVNAVGSFKYLYDKQNGVQIDTQFTQYGSGSITSSILIKAKGNTIKANQDGSVIVNGIKQEQKKGSLIINFIHNKIVTKRNPKGKNNLTYIIGLTDAKFGFAYEKKTKSYGLSVVASESSRGLFVDPEHPQKYQLSDKQSKFDKFIAFKLLNPTVGTKEERKKAMGCCHLLNSEVKVNQCISDFVRTKRCLVANYKENNPTDTLFK